MIDNGIPPKPNGSRKKKAGIILLLYFSRISLIIFENLPNLT
jgi:hypothetical protein